LCKEAEQQSHWISRAATPRRGFPESHEQRCSS
jgi:hypothetical protein